MNSGRHLRLAAWTLVGALVVGACGGDDDGPSGPPPTGGRATEDAPARNSTEVAVSDRPIPADGLVIRWTTRWWDPSAGVFGGPGRDVAVYADGTVVGTADVEFEAEPMIRPYVSGRIDPVAVADLLRAADDAGLLTPAEPVDGNADVADVDGNPVNSDTRPAEPVDGNADVAGAPVTFVELFTADRTVTHRVHALQTPPDDDSDYLAALRAFVERVHDTTRAALDPQTGLSVPPEREVAARIAFPGDSCA